MSRPKFKVGDKVRFVGGGDTSCIHPPVGTIGRIVPPQQNDGLPLVKWPDGAFAFGRMPLFCSESRLELVREQPRKILIMQDKADPMQVIARDLDSGKTALAKCSPKDTFDFYTGAKLAFNRLTEPERPAAPEAKPEPKPEAPKCKFKVGDNVIGNAKAGRAYHITGEGWRGKVVSVDEVNGYINVSGLGILSPFGTPVRAEAFDLDTQPKYYTGKVVCVRRDPACRYWTVGKVYEVKDGEIRDDDGDARRRCKSPEDIAGKCLASGTFVEFKGGAV